MYPRIAIEIDVLEAPRTNFLITAPRKCKLGLSPRKLMTLEVSQCLEFPRLYWPGGRAGDLQLIVPRHSW